MERFTRTVGVALILGLALPGLAAGPAAGCQPVRFDRLTTADGLSHNSVTYNHCIVQDRQGFIWIGTVDGLNKYDGKTFTIYRHEPGDSRSLSANLVYSLFVDRRGTLWVGTTAGLDRFDRESETFTRFTPPSWDVSADVSIRQILGDSRGEIWAGSFRGTYRFDPRRGRFVPFPPGAGRRSIHLDSRDRLYLIDPSVTASTRLTRFHIRAKEQISFDLPAGYCQSVLESRDGTVWLGSTYYGLLSWNPETGDCTHFRHDPSNAGSLGEDNILSLWEDSAGAIWVGTRNSGLNRFDRRTRTFFRFQKDSSTLGGLSDNDVESIFEDRGGTLWIGTYGSGVNLYSRYRNKFGRLTFDSSSEEGLNDRWIFPILEGPAGRIWIGTMRGGVNVWDPGTRRFTRFPAESFGVDPEVFYLRALCRDGSGTVWAGLDTFGLYRFNERRSRFDRSRLEIFASTRKEYNRVYNLLADPRGLIWAATNQGLFSCDPLSGEIARFRHDPSDAGSLSHTVARCVIRNAAGALWVGLEGGGLDRFNPATRRFEHFGYDSGRPGGLGRVEVEVICQGRAGVLWIGTSEGGLYRLDPKTGAAERFTRKDGLPNDTVSGILEDDRGNLWLSTNGGLSRFDPRTRAFRNFDTSDGLISEEFDGKSFCRDSRGTFYFGGLDGVIYFDPGGLPENTRVPPIAITRVKAFERLVRKDISSVAEMEFPHWENSLSFEFAALDFTDPGRNRYRYWMEGVDKGWVSCGNRTYAAYTNLSAGEYAFHVTGCNKDGTWNQEGVTVGIRILPPFWKTPWFIALSLAAFAVGSHLTFLFVRRFFSLVAFWKKRSYIGPYELLEPLGSGGMATVYRARSVRDKSSVVAIKVLKPEYMTDEVTQRRFCQEGELIDRLGLPHVVRVFERGQDQGRFYLVMEYLEGQTLADRMKTAGPMELARCLPLMTQLAETLALVHQKRIIHRDLKPANIMLIEQDGNPDYIKLLDFGLAKAEYHSRITETGMLLGTLRYLAPEQITKSLYTPPADIYALGVIFYEMLAGRELFGGENAWMSVVRQILVQDPPELAALVPGLPAEINALVLSMIRKKPEDRPSADDVLRRLQDFTS